MDFRVGRPMVGRQKKVYGQRVRRFLIIVIMHWALLWSGLFLSTVLSNPAFAQTDPDRCRGFDNFVKCRQEQMKKSTALQGKTAAARQSTLYKGKSEDFRVFLSQENKKQKHLQGVHTNARKTRERITKGVEKIIIAYKRRQAAMRTVK